MPNLLVVVLVFGASATALAQTRPPRVEAGAQLALLRLDAFSITDAGLGGRLTYNLVPQVGLEAELTLFPESRDDRGSTLPSRRRVEGLFGVKAGVRADRLGLYGKVRPGFVRFSPAAGPIPCILIYPPPLVCVVAGGSTAFALDVGGALDVRLSPRVLARIDAGDLLIRYRQPSMRRGRPALDGFMDHNIRLTAGVGIGFW